MQQRTRYDLIDSLRGLAIAEMFVFHFCFLLYEFGLGFTSFIDNPYWVGFRIVIVTSFLSIVGISLRLSVEGGLNQRSFFRRMLQLLVYGSAVIVATYFYEPRRTVVFGILQFILVASFLGLLFTRLTWQNLIIGILLVGMGFGLEFEWFDQAGFYWIGMPINRPITFDYVPMLPWFGVVLIGVYIGHWILTSPKALWVSHWENSNLLLNLLALMGRHSLNLYMLHVPLFYVFIYFVLV